MECYRKLTISINMAGRISNKRQAGTTIRNKLSQALIQGISMSIQSDNGYEFKKKVIDNY